METDLCHLQAVISLQASLNRLISRSPSAELNQFGVDLAGHMDDHAAGTAPSPQTVTGISITATSGSQLGTQTPFMHLEQ